MKTVKTALMALALTVLLPLLVLSLMLTSVSACHLGEPNEGHTPLPNVECDENGVRVFITPEAEDIEYVHQLKIHGSHSPHIAVKQANNLALDLDVVSISCCWIYPTSEKTWYMVTIEHKIPRLD